MEGSVYHQIVYSAGFHSRTCNKIGFLLKENINHFPQVYALTPLRTTSLGHQRISLCQHRVGVLSTVDFSPHCDSFYGVFEVGREVLTVSFLSPDDTPCFCPASGTLKIVLRRSNKSSNGSPRSERHSRTLQSSHERWYFWKMHRRLFLWLQGDY